MNLVGAAEGILSIQKKRAELYAGLETSLRTAVATGNEGQFRCRQTNSAKSMRALMLLHCCILHCCNGTKSDSRGLQAEM